MKSDGQKYFFTLLMPPIELWSLEVISIMLSVGVANYEDHCDSLELLHFQPPNATTCGEYICLFDQLAHGAVYDPEATSPCSFRTLSDTNTFLAPVDSFYDDRWRNLGADLGIYCF